jgi:hypothetical protein
MYSNLEKYDSSYKAGTMPDFGLWGSYIAADLMIKGRQGAGANPSRQSFITNLRKVTNYDAGGLLPSPTSFANFGTPDMIPSTACEYFVQLKAGKFVPGVGSDRRICGQRISFSS